MRFSQPRDSDEHGLEGIDRPWIVRRDQTVTANQTWSARCRVFALKEASDLAPAYYSFPVSRTNPSSHGAEGVS